MDLDDLLYRAKWGRLEASEIDWLRAELVNPGRTHNVYTVLHALGKAVMGLQQPVRESDIELVSSFLSPGRDPEVAGLALRVLCHMWGLGARFEAEMVGFSCGVDWDNEYSDLAAAAVGCLGAHIRESGRHQLLKVLVERLERVEADDLARSGTLDAIGRALGAEWSELPPASGGWPVDGARLLVERVRQVIADSGG